MSFIFNLFLPHHGNNHKAHAIKSYSLLGLSLLFVLLQGGMNLALIKSPDVLGYSANISPERIVELTNKERKQRGLSNLVLNNLLSEAARQKAGDMFAFNYWAHNSPSGRTPWAFFSDVGYRYQYAGENLARDFKDPDSVVVAWMNSPSHKDNIVNAKYQEIGVAVVDGTLQGTDTTLVVQLFGTTYGSVVDTQSDQDSPVVLEKTTAVQPLLSSREVLSQSTNKAIPLTNPLDLTKAMTILIVGILIGVFGADLVMVSHQRSPRFSSRSFAQMLFLFFVLGATLLIKQGAVL